MRRSRRGASPVRPRKPARAARGAGGATAALRAMAPTGLQSAVLPAKAPTGTICRTVPRRSTPRLHACPVPHRICRCRRGAARRGRAQTSLCCLPAASAPCCARFLVAGLPTCMPAAGRDGIGTAPAPPAHRRAARRRRGGMPRRTAAAGMKGRGREMPRRAADAGRGWMGLGRIGGDPTSRLVRAGRAFRYRLPARRRPCGHWMQASCARRL